MARPQRVAAGAGRPEGRRRPHRGRPAAEGHAEKADTHIAIRPGGDWAFLLGLIKVIFDNGWDHKADCAQVTGIGHVRALAAEADLDDLSAKCDVPVEDIVDVAGRFALAPTAMCMTHTGVSQNRPGTIGEWLGHLLNAVTGRVDRPGGRRFEPGYVDVVKTVAMLARPVEGSPGCGACRRWPATTRWPSWPTRSPPPGRGGSGRW